MISDQCRKADAIASPSAGRISTILVQLLANNPSAVTYAAIESAITDAGCNPFEVNDLYQGILYALDNAHVPVVEQFDDTSSIEQAGDLALELADETLAQLCKTYSQIDQFRHTLLTAADERRLLEIYHDGVKAAHDIHDHSGPKQRLAFERRVAAGRTALDELVRHNLRLVAAQAHKFIKQARHLDLEDLLQEGLIGLYRAIKLYRLDLGHRLSTYATYWIRQAISRAIADQDRMIRLPVHLIESIAAIGRATQQLTITLGRDPSDEELAAYIGQNVTRVHQIRQLQRDHISLDLPIGTEGDATLGDMLPDTRMLEPETALIERSQLQDVQNFVSMNLDLSEIERQVINLRYGLENGKRHTLQEIGDSFNLTRERIRQLEVRALEKLKIEAKRGQLMAYLQD